MKNIRCLVVSALLVGVVAVGSRAFAEEGDHDTVTVPSMEDGQLKTKTVSTAPTANVEVGETVTSVKIDTSKVAPASVAPEASIQPVTKVEAAVEKTETKIPPTVTPAKSADAPAPTVKEATVASAPATAPVTPTAIKEVLKKTPISVPTVLNQGARLQSKEQLREVFTDATRVEEYTYVPKQWGGISLMGLISRLMGDRTNKDYESIDTKRYLYRAFKDKEVLGIAHGSTNEYESQPFDVFVYYDPSSKIRDLRVEKLPDEVVKKLSQGGYLQQFVSRGTSDFSVEIGRHGRVKDWGDFAKKQRRPSEGVLRQAWEKIVRTVRFNAAFVEVAYFITQHPLDSQTASSR